MSAEYWEPWQPEIGQRVRVNLSGECQVELSEAAPPPSVTDAELRGMMRLGVDVASMFQRDGRKTGHPTVFNGALGRVTSVYRDDVALGHFYRVMFDDKLDPDGEGFIGADFAAIELEPVEAES